MIIDIIFNLSIILVIIFAFFYLNKATKYENDINKKILSFLCLTLFILFVKSFARIIINFNIETILLSPIAILVYDYLIVLCILFSLYYLKDLEFIDN